MCHPQVEITIPGLTRSRQVWQYFQSLIGELHSLREGLRRVNERQWSKELTNPAFISKMKYLHYTMLNLTGFFRRYYDLEALGGNPSGNEKNEGEVRARRPCLCCGRQQPPWCSRSAQRLSYRHCVIVLSQRKASMRKMSDYTEEQHDKPVSRERVVKVVYDLYNQVGEIWDLNLKVRHISTYEARHNLTQMGHQR